MNDSSSTSTVQQIVPIYSELEPWKMVQRYSRDMDTDYVSENDEKIKIAKKNERVLPEPLPIENESVLVEGCKRSSNPSQINLHGAFWMQGLDEIQVVWAKRGDSWDIMWAWTTWNWREHVQCIALCDHTNVAIPWSTLCLEVHQLWHVPWLCRDDSSNDKSVHVNRYSSVRTRLVHG